ncbi:PrsW family intramembrane metalloprotease [Mycolicibacterium novocastrense]|nr:PrsW family intramembrane metalloprotease [Mycolicibacterium novocastrense]
MSGNGGLGQLWSMVLTPETFTDWEAALTAPIIEEASKALCAAVVLVLGAHVLNRISHALMVGMFVGFGFDLMEDLSYAANSALQDLDSDMAGAGGNLVVRFFTAVPAHWTYTALTSVGVLLLLPSFRDRERWSTGRRLAIACGLLLSGPLLHFTWNAPGPVAAMPLKMLGSLAFFLVVAALLLRDERRWVIARIEAGRASGELATIGEDVLDSLPTRRRRRALRKSAKRSGGRAAAKAVKAQQRAALDRIQRYGETTVSDEFGSDSVRNSTLGAARNG